MRSRLVQTEEELRNAKAKAGVFSIDDTKKVFTEENSKIQQAIFDAEAELAERQASVAALTSLLHTPGTLPSTNTQANSNALAGTQSPQRSLASANPAPGAATNDVNAPIPSEKVAEYRRLCSVLDGLEKKQQELLGEFTPGSTMLKPIEERVGENQKLKAQMEEQFPALLTVPTAQTKTPEVAGANPRLDLTVETAKVAALQAKIRMLASQFAAIRTNAAMIDRAEGSITELQRKKELEEAHYKYFAANLEQSRIDEALGAGRVSNISKIQAPSPPFRDGSKLQKIQAGALLGSMAAALGLAFIVELLLDRSLKRPGEIEGKLGLPLFISIPVLNGNGKAPRLNGAAKRRLLAFPARNGRRSPSSIPHPTPGLEHPSTGTDPLIQESTNPLIHDSGSSGTGPSTQESTNPPIHDPGFSGTDPSIHQSINPLIHGSGSINKRFRLFSDALRDRLITYFEIKNLTHKPKLVSVTSFAAGAGVSTIATNLAASLSEVGDGNVLLVDMHTPNGAAHDFHHGKLACGIDDALELDKRGEALVQENLYMVRESANGSGNGVIGNGGNANGSTTANGEKLPRVLPKRFNRLLPRLKASDYDYIIFDMPPINQVSVTPRLARFMDMVLLVVESEKTDRDVVKRGTRLIAESHSNIGIILNKARAYVPQRLHQEM